VVDVVADALGPGDGLERDIAEAAGLKAIEQALTRLPNPDL